MVKGKERNPTETLGLWEATESNSIVRLVTSKTRRRLILRSPKSKERDGTSPFGSSTLNGQSLREIAIFVGASSRNRASEPHSVAQAIRVRDEQQVHQPRAQRVEPCRHDLAESEPVVAQVHPHGRGDRKYLRR